MPAPAGVAARERPPTDLVERFVPRWPRALEPDLITALPASTNSRLTAIQPAIRGSRRQAATPATSSTITATDQSWTLRRTIVENDSSAPWS